RVTVAHALDGGADGEVARGGVVELVPADRERHRHAGPDPGAVGGHHGGTTHAGGVDEHPPAAVVLHELGGGEVRVEGGGPGRDGTRGGGRILHRDPPLDGHEHVDALGAARPDRPLEVDVGKGP